MNKDKTKNISYCLRKSPPKKPTCFWVCQPSIITMVMGIFLKIIREFCTNLLIAQDCGKIKISAIRELSTLEFS